MTMSYAAKQYTAVYKGTEFYPFDKENYSGIDIEIIAHALSQNCRFCGHTKYFWSVAQHSMCVGKIIEEEAKCNSDLSEYDVDITVLIGYLHDASEAYISDICRPFKKELSDYLKYEADVQNKIYKAFDISKDMIDKYYKLVDDADNLSLYVESTELMNPSYKWLSDSANEFQDSRIDKYKKLVNQENAQMAEAKLIKMIKSRCKKLGIASNLTDKIPDTADNEIAIYNCGKIVAYAEDLENDYYKFKTADNRVVTLSKKDINRLSNIGYALGLKNKIGFVEDY